MGIVKITLLEKTITFLRENRNSLVILVLISLIAIFLRFHNITERGLWETDSAYYSNIAKAPILTVRWLYEHKNDIPSAVGVKDLKEYLVNRGVSGNPGTKPGHTFLIAVSFAIFGIKDYATLMVPAFFGLLTVWLTFIVGRKFFEAKVGLVAASVLAVSGEQIFYSRIAYPQTDTVFFGLLGTYFYLSSLTSKKKVHLVFAGLSFGFAMLMHQSVIFVILIPFLYELVKIIKSKETKVVDAFKRISLVALPILAFIVLTEAPLQIFFSHFKELQPGTTGQFSFFERTFYKAGRTGWLFSTADLLSFPRVLWSLEGPFVIFLFLIGLILSPYRLKKEHANEYLVILLQFLVPIVYWSFNYITTKAIQVALPSMALITGYGAKGMIERIPNAFKKRYSEYLYMLFIGLILIWGFKSNFELITLKAGYKETVRKSIEYIKENGGVITGEQRNLTPIWCFYLGNEYDKLPEALKDKIQLFSKEQGDLLVLDGRRYHHPETYKDLVGMVKDLEPIIVVPNSMDNIPIRYHHRQFKSSVEFYKKAYENTDIDEIKVYDLRLGKSYNSTRMTD